MKPKASAYVKGNRLCILGIANTKIGAIPFAHAEPCKAGDGPVDMTATLPLNVKRALDKSEKAIMKKVKESKLQLTIQSLVQRARSGDQNAMGTIVMIRVNAKKGSPRARRSLKALEKYAAENPPTTFGDDSSTLLNTPENLTINTLNSAVFNEEANHVVAALSSVSDAMPWQKAGAILANGPPLFGNTTRLKELCDAACGEKENPKIISGIINWRDAKAESLGRCIGLARTIQLVSKKIVPIAELSTMAAWELGE